MEENTEITDENLLEKKFAVVNRAAKILLGSGVVLFPTDTTYALGVNALDQSAIEKVYNLKLRPPKKPMHVIVSNLEMAEKYVCLPDIAYKLARLYLPGPLTLIVYHKNNIPENLVAGFPTLGFRIPGNAMSLELVRTADVPVTATSANISGQVEVYSPKDFKNQIKQFNPQGYVDYIINQGTLPSVKPSTIVDLTKGAPKILREGPISAADIASAIKNEHA